MIWTTQNSTYSFSFSESIELHTNEYVYGSDTKFYIYFNYEKFKYSNIPLIVKRLKKVDKNAISAINLLDILGHESTLNQVYDEMVALGNIQFLKLDASQITEKIKRLTSLKGLIISGTSTETLPDYLSELPNLEWFDAAEIRLNYIPDCIFKMPLLRGLKLKTKSAMKQLPLFFDSLPNLEFLELLGCGITAIPENVTNLSQLKVLSLEANKLVKLPKSFSELTNLSVLILKVDTKVATAKHQYYLPPQLTQLSINDKDGAALTVLPTIEANLQVLRTDFNVLEQNLSALSCFTKLEKISLSGINTKQGNEVIFKALSGLESLHTLSLSYHLKLFTKNLRHIKQLKHLALSFNPASDLLEIGVLENLESLFLGAQHYKNDGFVVPESWNNLQKLTVLEFKNDGNSIKTDLVNLRKLSALKELTFNNDTLNLDAFLKHNPQIEILRGYAVSENLPSIRLLTHLKSFRLNTDIFDGTIPKDIQHFTQLEDIHLYLKKDINLEDLPSFLTGLGQISTFKTIEISENELEMSKDWHVLNVFKHINIKLLMFSRPPSVYAALLPHAEFKPFEGWSEEYRTDFFQKFVLLKNYDFNDAERMTFFGMIVENTENLREHIDNQLPHTLSEGSCIYLSGKLHGMTKPQTIEQLASKNIQVANKLTDAVTHIVFGNGLSVDEAAKIVGSGKELALSEYLTEWLNSPDDFYLLQEENLELTQNIIPLFLSEEHSNHQLALEMLKGGGVTKRLLNYLLVFQGCHPNLDVRKDARKLFKRFAPADLYQEIGTSTYWKYMKGELSEHLFKHPYLNYWDGVLAYQQFRNATVIDRLQRTWTFSRDQPQTLTVSKTNILTIDALPAELSLVRANGIISDSMYVTADLGLFIEQLGAIPKLFPQLGEHFYCKYGDIEMSHYQALKACFKNVHLTDYFKIKQ